jgi:hypothetical protein
MAYRPRKSDEEKRRIVNAVDALREKGLTKEEASRQVGIHFATYYAYRNELNPTKKTLTLTDGPKKEVSDLTFSVVKADEAKDWITTVNNGRFTAMKESLITQLRGLRKSEALSFPAPTDKKEIQAILSACHNALRHSGIDWWVRYSVSKKVFIAMHNSRIPRRRYNTNGKDEK